MVLDEVDDMISILDGDHNIIWMNPSARKGLDIGLGDAVGCKCYRVFGGTCCCDGCAADNVIGGPRRRGRGFAAQGGGDLECLPVPYMKDGRTTLVIQHIRRVQRGGSADPAK